MRLSELKELSPLAWEEAKRETIKELGIDHWIDCVNDDDRISCCFTFYSTKNFKMWENLHFDNDPTLLREWEAKQIKKD